MSITTRSLLIQKAKKLGIKNIGKKNMITLKRQITQKQNAGTQVLIQKTKKSGIKNRKMLTLNQKQKQISGTTKFCYYDPSIQNYKRDELRVLASSCGMMKTSKMNIKELHNALKKTYNSNMTVLSNTQVTRYLRIARLRHESWQWHDDFMEKHPFSDYVILKTYLVQQPFYKQLVQIDQDYPHK